MTNYAVATRATYGPGNRSKADQLAERLAGVYRTQPGFEHAYFITFDDAAGEFGSLIVFDTRAHAEAALDASRQPREETGMQVGIQRKGTPERRVVELFGPAE
jgi:hypothetical protein